MSIFTTLEFEIGIVNTECMLNLEFLDDFVDDQALKDSRNLRISAFLATELGVFPS